MGGGVEGGFKLKHLLWEGYAFFLEQHNQTPSKQLPISNQCKEMIDKLDLQPSLGVVNKTTPE